VRKQQFNHFIFEGPPGVGKRTMAIAFLRDTIGPQKLKVKVLQRMCTVLFLHLFLLNSVLLFLQTKNELRKIELKVLYFFSAYLYNSFINYEEND